MTRSNAARLAPLLLACLALFAGGCTREAGVAHEGGEPGAGVGFERGPHGGRLLVDGDFALELAIFETGVPPEFHAWATSAGRPVNPADVSLTVELARLGGRVDRFAFAPRGDHLRGEGVVEEPHSFSVGVIARHAGREHAWHYDSFEGRTRIAADLARAAGIEVQTAGPARLVRTLRLHGRVEPDPAWRRAVAARFPGVIRSVRRAPGDRVRAGETLAEVESDDSLRTYAVTAPIDGVVVARDANPGEHSQGRMLFTLVDPSRLQAVLTVFARDRASLAPGTAVTLRAEGVEAQVESRIARIDLEAGEHRSVLARVPLPPDTGFAPGVFVIAEAAIGQREVPLAVRGEALQTFRDFEVVYEQVGEEYEVRMLEIGERAGEWVEVLRGLEPGARYVTTNSYLVKADIEKAGASHDH